MNSTSVVHWIIVLAVLAGIVFLIRREVAASKATTNSVAKREKLLIPMQWLTGSFIVYVSSLVVIIVSVGAGSSDDFGLLQVIVVLAMIIAALGFYICLGILAKRLGQSGTTWIVLTIITNPIGTFVAYFLMRRRVAQAISHVHEETAP